MKINTPVATMGIRGTTGWVQEIATITANLGNVSYSFAVVDDFNSTGHGQYDLIDANGNIIATVSQTGYVTYVTPQGVGQQPLVSTAPMTNSQLGFEQQIIQQVFGVLNSINNPNPNPQSTPGTPGSGTPPNQLNELPHLLQENSGQPFAVNIPLPGPSGTSVSGTVTINTTTQQQQAITQNNNPTSTVSWTSTTGGDWNDPANWSDALAPTGSQNVDITLPVKVTIDGAEEAASLVIGAGGILNIIAGGEIVVANGISNAGVLQLNSSGGDPQLVIDGTVYLLGGGTIEFKGPAAQNVVTGFAGSGATLVNVDNTIEGSGIIGQGDGALTLVNGSLGTIDATPLIAGDSGVLTINTGNTVSNSGLLEAGNTAAATAGTLQIDDVVDNAGLIDAVTAGSILDIKTDSIAWTGGTATAGTNGILIDAGAQLLVDLAELKLTGGGAVSLAGGMIEGFASGNILDNVDNTISGYGTIGGAGGALTLENAGVIEANISGQALVLDTGNAIVNAGTLEATNGGTLIVDDNVNGTGSATISGGGTLEFQSGVSTQQTVTFNDATGTLALADPAAFHASLTGLVDSDTIDLTNIAPSDIKLTMIEGSTLVVAETNGSVLTFNIAGSLPGNHFSVQGDSSIPGVSVGHGTDLVLSAAVAPTITGTVAGQPTTSEAPVDPFSGVTIVDANNGGTDTLTITFSGNDGTLADGADFHGLTGSNGNYTLSGTAAAITSELDALVFTPVDGVPNTAVTTAFTLSDFELRLQHADSGQHDHGDRHRSGGGADDHGNGSGPAHDLGSAGRSVLRRDHRRHQQWRDGYADHHVLGQRRHAGGRRRLPWPDRLERELHPVRNGGGHHERTRRVGVHAGRRRAEHRGDDGLHAERFRAPPTARRQWTARPR